MVKPAVFLLMGIVAVSCIPKSINNQMPEARTAWQQEWARHYEFLEGIAKGGDYDQYQLYEPIDFFETTTGIRSGLDGTSLGYIMDRAKLRLALKRWAAWRRERIDEDERKK